MIPLSHAQQRLWFISQFEGQETSYNVPLVFHLRGEVDAVALERALNDVVARHESLRTVLPELDGMPWQVVMPVEQAPLVLEQAQCTESELGATLEKIASRSFDLRCDLPIRATLLARTAGDATLVLLLHHIVSDGWSMGPLLGDLSLAYAARCAGGVPGWEPLAVQYADYAVWQRETLGEEDDPDSLLSEQLAYWRTMLKGLPVELTLPADRPRPPVPTFKGDTVTLSVPASLHSGLTELARITRTTLFTILQTAIAVLLSRMGAGTDIVLGTPVAGRTDDALDPLIGFFVNTLALRTDLSGDPTFRELIGQSSEAVLCAFENQDVPFDRVVEELNPERRAGRHPLFQTMVALQNAEAAGLELPGLLVEQQRVRRGTAKFDLLFSLVEHFAADGAPEGMDCVVEYAEDRFEAETARMLGRSLIRLLDSGVATPDLAVNRLDLLAPQDRRLVLYGWNEVASGAAAPAGDPPDLPDLPNLVAAGRAGHLIRPVAGHPFFVLDETLEPVPPGAPGELYIGGSPLARGYVAPPPNAQRFVACPYGDAGRRMYRTGGRFRWTADGSVEYLGQIDEAPPGPRGRGSAHQKSGSAPGAADYAPRTPREAVLCGLFAEVLGLESVGVHDDFFALGGHSLLATRLVSRIRTELGQQLGLRKLFEHPTVARLAARLTPGSGSGSDRPPLTARARGGPVPASFAQQRLWFTHELESHGAAYHVPIVLNLPDGLDAGAIESALLDVIARHESLRTVFHEEHGVPWQVVLPAEQADFGLRRVGCAADELSDVLAEVVNRPFDLAARVPVRAALIEVAPSGHVLALVLHHIACDGWSMGPLLGDLSRAYAARYAGGTPDWAPLPVQYADYAIWQRELLGDGDDPDSLLSSGLAFWREALAGIPEELVLPADRPRNAAAGLVGDAVRLEVPADLHRELEGLARSCGVTLFMVLQAGVAVLLSRVGAGPDIVVGTPVAGRSDVALDELVGFFVNMVVLRTDVSGDPSVRALLARVRAADLAAFDHQEVPFERLVEELNPARSPARHPLFQCMVTLNDTAFAAANPQDSGERAESSGSAVLRGERMSAPWQYSKFDVSFHHAERRSAARRPDGIRFAVEYAPALFDRDTVTGLAERYLRILLGFAEQPDDAVSALPILTPAERRYVLTEFNETAVLYPADAGLHALVEQQAARTPDAVALVSGVRRLTYQELDARANQLAWHLTARGARRGEVVCIYVERDLALIIALLATLKAGCAYSLLDPTHPSERLRAVFRQTGARLLVAARALSGRLAADSVTAVLIDAEDAEISARPAHAPRSGAGGDDLACVMFTSGSTGQPKGVASPHRALVATFVGSTFTSFGPDRVFLQCSPVSWDGFALEVFGALLHGGTCVLQPGQSPEMALVGRLSIEQGVTALQLSSSLFNVMVDEGSSALATVDQAMIGGEAASAAHVARALREYPGLTVLNGYGPVESMGFTTSYQIAVADVDRGAVPIGRPIASKRAYLLDDQLRPVPPAAPGEVYVAGAGLAYGYASAAALTAERFVADPYGAPGARMYRTGDLGRMNRAGELEFLGRVDQQVKIRGFRVEPDEVCAVLLRHPAVTQAAVIARSAARGGNRTEDKQLVAYVVAQAPVDRLRLRAYLAERLPDYMVPSVVLLPDALPLTPNGKLDRDALAAPHWSTAAYRAPTTHVEDMLCGLFAEVLGVPTVGADDGFFELGGHSLLAARLVARVRTVLGAEVGLRLVFESPTPARLAASLARAGGAAGARAGFGRQPRRERVPLSFAQQRLWFIDRFEGPSATYNVPLVARLRGGADVTALEHALADVAARHESLRTLYQEEQGVPWQDIVPAAGARVSLERADCTEAELDAALREFIRRPFRLEQESPIRALLLSMEPGDEVLALVLHHIACDGHSMGPLQSDLAAAYAARRAGAAPDWAPLAAQYADYAIWQRERLGAADDPRSVLSEELARWRQMLAAIPEELVLPTDRPHPTAPSFRGGEVSLELPVRLHEQLTGLARSSGVTLFMVLQAAVAALLGRLSGGTDIVLGTSVSDRTDAALDPLIGFFINTVVLRTDLAGDPTVRALVARVREADLDAYAHQELPFDLLVEELNPARAAARHPLFQHSITLQTEVGAAPGLNLPGLRAQALEVGWGISKFDLSFHHLERRGPEGQAGIGLQVEYADSIFDRSTVEVLVERYLRVLRGFAADPDRRVSGLDILSDTERARLATGTVAAAAAARVDQPIAVCSEFEEQASRSPDGVALLADDGQLTYRELAERSARLSRHLAALGIGPEKLVAVAVPRSAAVIVAILAVLRAGAAYLPVDPGYPADRIAYMLGDARPVLVLTEHGTAADLAARVPRFAEFHQILLDDPDTAAEVADRAAGPVTDADRTRPLRAAQAAYVIYTSGSTGQPKGTVLTHGAMADRTRWLADVFGLTETDRILQFASTSFDVHVEETFPALTRGAGVLLFQGRSAELPELLPTPAYRSLTILDLPPLLIHELLAAGTSTAWPPALRLMIAGSDSLTSRTVEAWQGRFGDEVALMNVYGPTEATVTATAGAVLGDTGLTASIGAPAQGTRAYVLDDALGLVPDGSPGELYLVGNLARGYLRRPGLTSGRFVACPFGPPGERMYRTGDLVRWPRDGSGGLEFLGRADHQIKLRGHRIEPGEIEAVLTGQPGVLDAVVALREDSPSSRRLVGYVVARPGARLEPAELRAALSLVLPDYMLPAAVVVLDKLPLTANGKLDRGALPSAASPGGRRPADPREEIICRLFAELLGLDSVPPDDSFFTLGGHSMLAARLARRLQAVFGVEIPLPTLFDGPTAATLAERIGALDGASALRPLLVIRPGSRLEPLFCFPPLWGLSWCYTGLSRHLAADRPLYGVQARGVFQDEPLPRSVTELVEDYLEQLRSVQPTGPYHLLGWSRGGNIAHEVAVRLQAQSEQVAFLAQLDTLPSEDRTGLDHAQRDALATRIGLAELGEVVSWTRGPGDGEVPTVRQLVQTLRESGSVLAFQSPRRMAAHVESTLNCERIFFNHRPGVFHGDVLFFQAARRQRDGGSPAAAWRDYIKGHTTVVDVDCLHQEMMEPGPVAHIGRVVDEYLSGRR